LVMRIFWNFSSVGFWVILSKYLHRVSTHCPTCSNVHNIPRCKVRTSCFNRHSSAGMHRQHTAQCYCAPGWNYIPW
jgi:hypothetical protein